MLRHFGIDADTVLEFWDGMVQSWVTTVASAPIHVDVWRRSVFGHVKGLWAPEGFLLELLLSDSHTVNQAVFDDPWALVFPRRSEPAASPET